MPAARATNPIMRPAAVLVFVLAACPASQVPSLGGDDDAPCPAGSPECPASCAAPRTVGDFELCTEAGADSYTVIVRYDGPGQLAVDAGAVTLNGEPFDARA